LSVVNLKYDPHKILFLVILKEFFISTMISHWVLWWD